MSRAAAPLLRRSKWGRIVNVGSTIGHGTWGAAAAYAPSKAAVKSLIGLLQHPDSRLRAEIASVLEAIGSHKAVDPLIARLEDDDTAVRMAIARALGAIGSDKAVDPLIARLEDDETEVRRSALLGLSKWVDDVDRRLLSRDLDGVSPFLDPREPIRRVRVEEAASELELSVDEVQRRYEALVTRFGLRME